LFLTNFFQKYFVSFPRRRESRLKIFILNTRHWIPAFARVTILTNAILFLSVIVPVSAFALDFSKPLAGDSRCGGSSACSILDIFPLLKDVFVMSIVLLAFFAIIAIVWAGVRGLTAKDQPAVLESTKKQLGVIVTSIVVAILFIGGLAMAFWNAFVTQEYRTFFGRFSSLIEDTPVFGILHSYAAGLPNPLVVNSVYDVGILLFQLSMRWIMIPVLIGSWVWAGFLFIQAQGNPEKLKYARERLWYSFVWTIILMLVLGIAFAFRNTFNQIFQ